MGSLRIFEKLTYLLATLGLAARSTATAFDRIHTIFAHSRRHTAVRAARFHATLVSAIGRARITPRRCGRLCIRLPARRGSTR